MKDGTYRLSFLTIIVQLELHNDTLAESESVALNLGDSVAEVDLAEWLKKMANLLGSCDCTVLALNKEETWKRRVSSVCSLEEWGYKR
jgi:hypothetical protein